jgi:hypothetical protein
MEKRKSIAKRYLFLRDATQEHGKGAQIRTPIKENHAE